MPHGSEPFWQFWFTGKSNRYDDGTAAGLCLSILRFLAFQEDPGDTYELTDFNLDSDPPRMNYMAQIYNADRPDLEDFRNRGGKLLMYQSWADPATTPLKTIEFYEEAENLHGGRIRRRV